LTAFERQTLANGVRVISAPLPHAASVACVIGLAAGARYEAPAAGGFAHFTEHMVFTGTARRSTMTELAAEVETIGGQQNASTSKELTNYWIKVGADHVATGLDLLADMIRNSRFDAADVEREKGVIVEEVKRKFQSPGDYVDELFEALLYGDQPIGRPVDGTEETVRAADRETLFDFYERWYTPRRTVVGLAGKIDGNSAALVEELIGDFEREDHEGPEPAVRHASDRRVELESKEMEQAELCLGGRACPLGHPDRYATHLLATLLGGGGMMSSRLYQELVAERGLAYSVFATVQSYVDAGAVWAQGGVDVDRIDEAVTAIAAAFRRAAEESVSSAELEKARNYAKGRFAFALETPLGLVSFGVRREAVEGQAADPDEVLDGLDAVTAADVQRVASDLVASGLHLAVVGPFDDAGRFETLLG